MDTERPQDIPDWVFRDWEWGSTVHLLSAPALWRDRRVRECVDFEGRSIDWRRLLEPCGWSHGERVLIRTAANLWDGRCGVSLRELVLTLDDGNFARVIDAMRLARRRLRGAMGGDAA